MSRYNKNLSFLFVSCFLLIGGFVAGSFYLYRQVKDVRKKLAEVSYAVEQETKSVKIVPQVVSGDKSDRISWIDVQLQAKNTVVKVVTDVAAFNWLEPYKTPGVSKGMGTGFFINSDGDIVTNYHVVNQARLVQIEIPALGVEQLKVKIVGVSPERDLALLRLTNKAKEKIKKVLGDIPFLKLGNSDAVRRGQEVLALGYPLGVQSLKSTQGIVSGRDKVKMIQQSCIQTTAPLNPGNSGGPTINSLGEVIGINFAGVIQAQNVGYIIPINDVKAAIKDLHKIKLLRRPTVGCLLEPSNEAMLAYLGNPKPGGFYIAKVYKNLMFDKVGIKDGDMIYEMNGFTLDKFGRATVPWNEDKVSVVDILARLEVGDKVDMIIYRNGERKEIDFILEPRLLLPIRFMYPDFEKIDYDTIAGLVVMELSHNHIPFLVENANNLLTYHVQENHYKSALLLSYVQPTSLSDKMRLLFPGMIIKEINGAKVKTLKDFREAVKKSRSTRFFTIRTKENIYVVFSVENILHDEDRLSQIYQFKKSSLIDAIA